MLIKTFNGLSGVFAALGEASHLPSHATEPAKKPSNLTVRAALKRKRMAQANPKPETKKPS